MLSGCDKSREDREEHLGFSSKDEDHAKTTCKLVPELSAENKVTHKKDGNKNKGEKTDIRISQAATRASVIPTTHERNQGSEPGLLCWCFSRHAA